MLTQKYIKIIVLSTVLVLCKKRNCSKEAKWLTEKSTFYLFIYLLTRFSANGEASSEMKGHKK